MGSNIPGLAVYLSIIVALSQPRVTCCSRHAYYSVLPNKYSDDGVLETVYATNRAGCAVQCSLSDNCVAASFLRAADEDDLNCQLHGAGVENEDHLNNHASMDYLITKANPNTG